MEKAKVSIVVPIYNVEKYLPECLDSLLCQTYDNIEIILIDDGSKDQSLAICQCYSKQYNRIVIVHQKNAGVSAARNCGINLATGDYIAFCDADDRYSTKFIESMVNCSLKVDMPLCRLAKCNPEAKECTDVSLMKDGIARPTQGIFAAWRGLYKREIILKKSLRFSTGRKTGEDLEFTYKYMLYCRSFSYVDKAVYLYRIIPTSIMHKASYSLFDAVDAMIDTVKYAEENGTQVQAKQYREDLLYGNAVRIIEFASVTVLTAGESPKRLFSFLKEKGYHKLVENALSEPIHYDSSFYKMYRLSPIVCFHAGKIRKVVGRVLRKWKLIQK